MKTLFDETILKNLKLKNRFFKAAVWENMATIDGHLTDKLYAVYDKAAKGGVGLILTGYAYVMKEEHPNPNMMGIYHDDFIPEHRKLTQMVHEYDTAIIMQLVYGGSMTLRNPPSPKIWGPSTVKNEMSGITPYEMAKEDIEILVDAFAKAAGRAKKAGFDGVELHGAHGYLLSQFLCPHYNKRKDEYGGSIENRVRIIAKIVEAIRRETGEEFLILIKINSEDFMSDGLTSEESITAVKILQGKGLCAVEVSGGILSDPDVMKNNLSSLRPVHNKEQESFFRAHAAKLADAVSIPVILTGGNRHIDVMEDILNKTNISYFALARPLICEPDLVKAWESGDRKSPKCISCNRCFDPDGVSCALNRRISG
ncbi:MAG: NADH:flavin oxidoreductase [Clostridiales bacterium]|nr:NADH:flavin oxidoreductase [Clostridiales bacterium]